MKKLIPLLLFCFGVTTSIHAQGKSGAARDANPIGNAGSIVDIVLIDDGEFDILQAAVIKAGLVEALSGPRQFTVFAPTDAAFEALFGADEATILAVIDGLDEEGVAGLTDILLYHVTSGRINSTAVVARGALRTLGGNVLTLEEIVEAGLALPNVSASNGVIHIIGGVLIPPAS